MARETVYFIDGEGEDEMTMTATVSHGASAEGLKAFYLSRYPTMRVVTHEEYLACKRRMRARDDKAAQEGQR